MPEARPDPAGFLLCAGQFGPNLQQQWRIDITLAGLREHLADYRLPFVSARIAAAEDNDQACGANIERDIAWQQRRQASERGMN